jgi:ribosome-binding protein aMBF1 (putative translation factor)
MDALVVAKARVISKGKTAISQERHLLAELSESRHSAEVEAALGRERIAFAARVRGARAILGWTQRELGHRVSLTQKSVNRMEQGTHDVRRSTVAIVERVLKAEGIEFEDVPGGGFKILVPEGVLSKLLDGSS